MKTFVWAELVCDACSGTIAGGFVSGNLDRRGMWKQAKEAGWVKTEENMLCKSCKKDENDLK